MHKRLELITNLAIIAAALLIGFTLVGQYIKRKQVAKADLDSSAVVHQLDPGRHEPSLAGYDWHQHPRTLVLALRYGCIHCEHDMEFYRRLAEGWQAKPAGITLISVFPDDALVAQHDLEAHALQSVPLIANTDFASLHVFGTPTLLLVNNQGTILHSWIGELSEQQQKDVMAAIQ